MPLYVYQAIAENGELIQGELAAESKDSLQAVLLTKGLMPKSIKQKKLAIQYLKKKIKAEDFLLFNQELIGLQKAGLNLPDALFLISDGQDNNLLAKTIASILEDLKAGIAFSIACSKYPDIFDNFYITTLKISEKTGNYLQGLVYFDTYFRKKLSLRKKVSQALTYPFFLVFVLILILFILFTFVMPSFINMYSDFDAELPYATSLLLNFVDNIALYGLFCILSFFVLIVLYHSFKKNEKSNEYLHIFINNIPIVGNINRYVNVIQISRTLSSLIQSGIPLVEGMTVLTGMIKSEFYSKKIHKASQSLSEGISLKESMTATGIFPNNALKLIEVGESSGSLGQMFSDIADFYEGILDDRLTKAMSLVEPIMMLIMGILIGGIIIVMYLPIFQMADIIQ